MRQSSFAKFAEVFQKIDRQPGSDSVKRYMQAANYYNTIRAKFIFGKMESKLLRDFTEFGKELLLNNLLVMPFRHCYFEFTHPNNTQDAIFVDEFVPERHSERQHIGILWMRYDPSSQGNNPSSQRISIIQPTALMTRYSAAQSGSNATIEIGLFDDEQSIDDKRRRDGQNVASLLLAIIGMLNSKGITKERVVVDNTTNAKRIKRGKRPLHNLTVVRIDRALFASGQRGGTHASPRPHWRRGHIRHLDTGRIAIVRPHPVMAIAPLPMPNYVVRGQGINNSAIAG